MLGGRYPRKVLIWSKACVSLSARLSITPFLVCTFAPPSSSLVTRSPSALSTTAGPAIKT